MFERLHSIGFVHNDIKPDNVLLNCDNVNNANSSFVSLIDFSAAKKYLDKKGLHKEESKKDIFEGNIELSSTR